jgi:16S rRNA (cytosine967-C5)-methyltransferase
LRVNTLRTNVDAVCRQLDTLEVSWRLGVIGDLVRVDKLQPVVAGGMLSRGEVVVQDEGAALVVDLLDPRRGETIIDACAAPGGKSLYAAARMSNEGRVVAIDVSETRIGLVAEAAARCGVRIVETRVQDFADPAVEVPVADRVLVDAPCTGLGVLCKRADLRWRREPSDVASLCSLQDRLLDRAADVVRPAGVLVYSTCTITPEENEDRVTDFLTRHPNFEIESAIDFVPSSFVASGGSYESLPHVHGLDGAFATRLRRIA